jgi:FKBP-type peptidyl-prolyl cis-trans isomerase
MRALLVALAGGLALARGKAVGGKDGLQVEVTLEARCKETQQAEQGDKVTVHYGGFLQDGEPTNSILCHEN